MPKLAFSRFSSLGLAPRLVALAVLLTALGGTSVAVSVISSARTALRDQILQTHLVMANLMAAQIDEYVDDVQRDAQELASRPELEHAYETNDYAALSVQLAAWLVTRQDRVDGLGVYAPDATMLAAARPRQQTSTPDVSVNSGVVRNVIETGELARGRAVLSKRTGNPIIPIFVPVRTPTGQIYGVFAETLSLGALSDSLLKNQVNPSSLVIVIDNSSGVTLVSSDAARVLSPETTGRNAASARARAGDRGTLESTSSGGHANLAAFTPVPSLNWAVLLQERSDDAFAPIDVMTQQALLFGGATVLLAALAAAFLAVSMVRSLRALRATAERMASGELSRRTGVRRGGEIGDLGHAFDRMADRLQDSVEELTRRALTDNLTGLPNRVLLRQRLDEELARGDKVALLAIDLDRFKEINDSLGHSCGDVLLQQLAERLTDGLRRSDTVSRLGGDEFAVLLPGSSEGHALAIAETVRRLAREPFELNGQLATIGASIGIATAPDHATDAETLLRCADLAMYVAKHGGQGVAVYTPESSTFDRIAA